MCGAHSGDQIRSATWGAGASGRTLRGAVGIIPASVLFAAAPAMAAIRASGALGGGEMRGFPASSLDARAFA
ncbi:MAG: hypothetical protein CML46_09630 [Rhodobacteraceae bacterium]|nr:hypothetical protein [Paracoccaceae bacterium]MBR27185.1 hypothetical protein [Paracoccaceae bacterium]